MTNLVVAKEKKAKADFNASSIIDHLKNALLADRDEKISLGGKCHGQRTRFQEYLNGLPKERLL